MIEKKLSQYGHSVIVASDGQEAHDKFVTSGMGVGAVDVILMDLKVCSLLFPCRPFSPLRYPLIATSFMPLIVAHVDIKC